MEPIRKDKPSLGLFIVMTALYFGTYFGLKHLVFGGSMPPLLNLLLIAACVGGVFLFKRTMDKRKDA